MTASQTQVLALLVALIVALIALPNQIPSWNTLLLTVEQRYCFADMTWTWKKQRQRPQALRVSPAALRIWCIASHSAQWATETTTVAVALDAVLCRRSSPVHSCWLNSGDLQFRCKRIHVCFTSSLSARTQCRAISAEQWGFSSTATFRSGWRGREAVKRPFVFTGGWPAGSGISMAEAWGMLLKCPLQTSTRKDAVVTMRNNINLGLDLSVFWYCFFCFLAWTP